MDRIRKLFRKIDPLDRRRLLEIMERLAARDLHGLDVQKLHGTDFHRIRTGRFRIIFHWSSGEAIVDSIRKAEGQNYLRILRPAFGQISSIRPSENGDVAELR